MVPRAREERAERGEAHDHSKLGVMKNNRLSPLKALGLASLLGANSLAATPGADLLRRTVIDLAGGESLRILTLDGSQLGERLGSAMATWRMDGTSPSVLISAPSHDDPQPLRGRLVCLSVNSFEQARIVEAPFAKLLPPGKLGLAISTAGDFNGDGFADLAIGAPYHGGRASRAGAVAILNGGSPDWTGPASIRLLESDSLQANFGSALDVAGDVNGDHYDDLVVGAPATSRHFDREGSAILYLGSPQGLNPVPAWQVWGGGKNARLGENVAPAGDVNGDGFDDVIIAAPRWMGALPQNGQARLYLGSPDGLEAEPHWTYVADRPFSVLGRALGRRIDLNHDGFADVVLGVPGLPGGKTLRGGGQVHVFLGRPGGLSTTPDIIWEGPVEKDGFGGALCLVGDMNGDGFPELAVGAPFSAAAADQQGVLRIFAGVPDGFSTTPVLQIIGGSAKGRYGWVLVPLGDIDGDGLADLGVGSPYSLSKAQAHGRCDVIFGSRGLSAPPTTLEALGEPPFVRAGPNLTMAAISEWRRPPPVIRHIYTAAEAPSKRFWPPVAVMAILAAMAFAAWRSKRVQLETLRRRLHDFLGSELSGFNASDPRLRRVLEELRAMVWTFKQDRLCFEALARQLSDWAFRFASERGLRLRLEIPEEPAGPDPVDPRTAEAAHAAVRVALSNVVEHARATEAIMRVRKRGSELIIEVEDNGRGMDPTRDVFDPNWTKTSGSRGLSGLRRQAQQLNGSVALESGACGGTRVVARLPFATSRSFRFSLNAPRPGALRPRQQPRAS
jgi:hypothetical protein